MSTLAMNGPGAVHRRSGQTKSALSALTVTVVVLALAVPLHSASQVLVGKLGLGHGGATPVPAVASPTTLPVALRAAISARLGSEGLSQVMAPDGGLHVVEERTHSQSWSLVPIGLARVGSQPVFLGKPAVAAEGARTVYAMGALSAWYRSAPSGIDQGFTIPYRPSGSGSSVSINLRSSGSLRPVLSNTHALAVKSASGHTVLTYGHLKVTGANGEIVPSHLAVTGDRVQIVMDDRGAIYPLTVDPVTQQAELTSPNPSASGGFGEVVAISADGKTALVGAPDQNSSQGEAYIFTGTNWSSVTPLVASDGAANDLFGISVALSSDGTTALVGAEQHSPGGHTHQGAAYVFSGPGWSSETSLVDPLQTAGDNFGSAVALSANGQTALVGAYMSAAGGHSHQGAAYIFTGTNWSTAVSLTSTDGAANDQFGYSAALSADGTVALVGAVFHNVGSTPGLDQGAAYVFSGASWSTQVELSAADEQADDNFGSAVALSANGAVALVGAPYRQVGSNPYQGVAYFFHGANWGGPPTEVLASDGAANDFFGYGGVSLSASGSSALIGALGHTVGSHAGQGVAYLLTGSNWANQTEITSSDGAAGDEFGIGTALSATGTVSLIGAWVHNVGSTPNQDQGAAYIFVSNPVAATSTISASPSSIAANGTSTATITVQAEDAYGNNLATGGATVALSTTAGHLGPVTDNGNGTYTASLTSSAMPGTATVTGTLNGSAIGSSATVTFSSGGYWTVAGDGGVFSFGPNFYGSTGNLKLNQPVFAITSTADGKGYWFVARDGGVFTYGDGVFHGSVPALGVHVTNIVGMAADTATGGYWLVGSDGGVYAFSAPFKGSLPGLGQHVSNVVGIAATSDGGGYYLVTSTGAVYAFGDAKYQGGANTLPRINAPIVGITVDSATGGYWEAGSDGGIYAYGAPFHGSAGGTKLNQPIVGIDATTDGSGYYLVASDGGVFSYNAPFLGSMGGKHLNAPMVGITVAG